MRTRGREIYIIAGVIAAVLIVAWWFLLFSPSRTKLADLDTQVTNAQTQVSQAQTELARLKEYERTAPQARVDILRLGKMLPYDDAVPSLMVELTRTAETSGVTIESITPADDLEGQPFGIQTVNVGVTGRFFDVVDYVYRIENYVAFRNLNVKVTGRLLQITQMQIAREATAATTTGTTGGTTEASAASLGDPDLTVTLTIALYRWSGSAGGATAAGATTTTGAAGGTP